MSDELIVRLCSPSLAGLKAGSLFSCRCDDPRTLTAELRRLNRALAPKGLRVLPLLVREGRALIYLYRPRALEKELQRIGARRLLEERGYLPGQCVAQLARRVRAQGQFPNEIGLFLSYPPEDVEGFCRHKGQNFKICGCWKVYGDQEAACRCFDRYDRCRKAVCRRLGQCPLMEMFRPLREQGA